MKYVYSFHVGLNVLKQDEGYEDDAFGPSSVVCQNVYKNSLPNAQTS